MTTIANFPTQIYLDRDYLLELPTQFTLFEADILQEQLQTISQTSYSVNQINLDFSQTTFIDSSGLIALCQIIQLARTLNINLVISKVSPQVNMVFSLAGLEKILSSSFVFVPF
jgi:anti-anti-sigma factor